MIYIYNSDKKYHKQIEYVFMNIFYVLGLNYEIISSEEVKNVSVKDIFIAYSEENLEKYYNIFNNIIRIKPSNKLFSEYYLKKESIPSSIDRFSFIEEESINENIISIFNDNSNLYISVDVSNKNVIETNIDFISDIFFMLTRYEEVVNTEAYEKETYNRFPGKESLAYKNGFLHRPIVNEDIDLVWKLIDKLNLGYERKSWWEDKDFAVCLTHDVDIIQKHRNFKSVIRSTGRLLIKEKRPITAVYNFFNYLRGYKKDPYYTFDYIIDIENRYKFKSSFYFMSGGNSEYDNRYSMEDKLTLNLLNEIENQGFEAGYHCSFNSSSDFSMMKDEKDILDIKIKHKPYGCRQHYLKFHAPITWRYYEQLGLLYDTSLTFADAEGFRCGTCFPYKPYDLLEDRILNIWEIPLIVMEGSLQNPRYRGYTPEQGLETTKSLIETVKKHRGVFTFLYHNTSFDIFSKELEGWKTFYEETMNYLGTSNCYGTSGRNIISKFDTKQ